MKAKSSKRSAHFGVEIVENPSNITLFFDGPDLPPIVVSAKTGHTGKKAHAKLKKVLDKAESDRKTKTPTKAVAEAVTEAVKTVSKEAAKVVSKGTAKGNGE